MGILQIGSRILSSFGRTKVNKRTTSNDKQEILAEEYNRLTDAVIELQAAHGTIDDPELESHEGRIKRAAVPATVIALASLPGMFEGEEVRSCGFSALTRGAAGRFRWKTGTPPTAVPGMIIPVASLGWWFRIYETDVSVQWFGATGDGETNDQPALQAAHNFGAKRVYYPDPEEHYRIEEPLLINADVEMYCDSRESAKIVYTGVLDEDGDPIVSPLTTDYNGDDYAIKINGDLLAPYIVSYDPFEINEDATFNVRRFVMRNLLIEAHSSHGIKFCATINPSVTLDHVGVASCAGYAMDFGEAVYFVTMLKPLISDSRGVRVRAYCDQFTIKEGSFGFNHDYDLDLSCPTFNITNVDFELNHATNGNKANVVIRTSDVTSGYGILSDCRFGPEREGETIAEHDIYLSNAGTTDLVLRGVRIVDTKHFSPPSGAKKVSPVLCDSSLGSFEMRGQVDNGHYTSPYRVTTTLASNVLGSTSYGHNFVERLDYIEPSIRGAFNGFADQTSFQALASGPFSAGECAWVNSHEIGVGVAGVGLQKVSTVASDPVAHFRNIAGVIVSPCVGNDVVHVYGHGSVVPSPINTILTADGGVDDVPIGTPVYVNGSGILSLTPSNPLRFVGRTASIATNALVRIDLAQPATYAGQPGSGWWLAGDIALKSNTGASNGPQLIGWKRITTGSAHDLGVDWSEVWTSPNNGTSAAMPSSGAWAQGDFVRNSNPVIANGAVVFGWYRDTTGSGHVAGTDWIVISVSASVGGSYTPVVSAAGGGFALGDGVVSGRYAVFDKLATVTIELTVGSGGSGASMGSGQLQFGLPPGVGPAINSMCAAGIFDTPPGTGLWTILQGDVQPTYIALITEASNYVNATTPFAIGTGDVIRMTATFAL